MTDLTATEPSVSPPHPSTAVPPTSEELIERLFGAVIGALEVASVHLGGRLGLYRALADGADVTARDLAARTGTDERYVREWLEQQAVAGLLTVDDPGADPAERRYALPAAHRPVLADEHDLRFLTPLAAAAVEVCRPFDALVDAYRTGEGVPFAEYGSDLVEAAGAGNGPQHLAFMADWLGALPDVHARLTAESPARVADVACGSAWSSIAIARTYPLVRVDATDVDETSIGVAQRNIGAAGLSERVHAAVRDASLPDLGGPYDLVTIFEALHDMSHPVAALRAAREALADGGSVLVVDERVAEEFTAPGDEIERLIYGFSILHCLAIGRVDPDSAATGAVMRPATLRAYAHEAGFTRVEVLPIEHDFWRFYRLQE